MSQNADEASPLGESAFAGHVLPGIRGAVAHIVRTFSDTPDIAQRLMARSFELNETGRPDLAMIPLAAACVMCERSLGLNHSSTLTQLGNLAKLYHSAEFLLPATRLLEYVLPLMTSERNPLTALTVSTRLELASCLCELGQIETAIRQQEQLVCECESQCGVEHQHTLSTQSSLAEMYRHAGRPRSAADLNYHVLGILSKKYGDTDSRAVTVRHNLCLAFLVLGSMKMQSLNTNAWWQCAPSV